MFIVRIMNKENHVITTIEASTYSKAIETAGAITDKIKNSIFDIWYTEINPNYFGYGVTNCIY